jgi:hypothetical protein
MRKTTNIVQITLGITLYCFTVFLAQAGIFHSYTKILQTSQQVTEEEKLIVNSIHVLDNALTSENYLSTFSCNFSFPAKNQSKVFFSTSKITEQILRALYVQYAFYVRNLLICSCPTDIIIFPC